MTAYERRDLSPARIAKLAGGLFAALLLSAGGVAILFALSPPRPASDAGAGRMATAEPRLEVHEGSARAALERTASQRLHSYAWTDSERAHARIPIERAMQILVEQGWPDDKPNQAKP